MPDARPSKGDRREAAREQARLTRERQKRRERAQRWLIPSGVTVVVLAVVAIVVFVVATSGPVPQTTAGPKNMITDGILFTGQGGKTVATTTPGLKPKQAPSPVPAPTAGAAQIVSYIDWSCPACKAFEATNGDWIHGQVAAGTASLEVHPVAILNRSYSGSQYSQRVNNAAACVANFDPDSFLPVQKAIYAQQPAETSSGLTNSQIIAVIHGVGLSDSQVDSCVNGLTFDSWVTAATGRFGANSSLANPATGGTQTPTVFVNGQRYAGSITDLAAFKQFFANASAG